MRARSPNRRSADQYLFLHVAWQKRCGEPPRRPRKARSHQSQTIEDPSVITPFRALTVRSAALLYVVPRTAPIKCDRCEKRHDGRRIEPRARGLDAKRHSLREGIASYPNRFPRLPPLDSGGALGGKPRLGCPF